VKQADEDACSACAQHTSASTQPAAPAAVRTVFTNVQFDELIELFVCYCLQDDALLKSYDSRIAIFESMMVETGADVEKLSREIEQLEHKKAARMKVESPASSSPVGVTLDLPSLTLTAQQLSQLHTHTQNNATVPRLAESTNSSVRLALADVPAVPSLQDNKFRLFSRCETADVVGYVKHISSHSTVEGGVLTIKSQSIPKHTVIFVAPSKSAGDMALRAFMVFPMHDAEGKCMVRSMVYMCQPSELLTLDKNGATTNQDDTEKQKGMLAELLDA
jgi:hypothetical protein